MARKGWAAADVRTLEASLGVMQAVALAQTRWRDVAAAIEEGRPLPLDGLTPDQEHAVTSLPLIQLSPRSRDQVRELIDTVESTLRQRREELDDADPGTGATPGGVEEAPGASAPTSVRWFPGEPRAGGWTMVTSGTDRTPERPRPTRDAHEIRLMNDYAVTWPLWPSTPEVTVRIARHLDDEVVARLRRWARTFNDHYDHMSGWDDRDVAAEHRAEGEHLLAALRDALPEPWHVRLEYWETNGS